MIITIETSFASSHKLYKEENSYDENYRIYGNCCNLHGHNYKLFVSVEGNIKNTGMVINFKELKSIINRYINNSYDHKNLNDVIDTIPTAENLVEQIWKDLNILLRDYDAHLYELKLYETDKSYVTLRR